MPTPDYPAWRFWLDVIQIVATLGVAIYVWFVNRDRVTNARISSLREENGKRFLKLEQAFDTRMDSHSERLARVEATCGHRIGHDELSGELTKVYDRINGLATDGAETKAGVANLQGEMQGVLRQLHLISEHLMNNGGKGS